MRIGNIETKSDLFLAPMAGVTDKAFREICSFFGAGLCYTEMISVKGLLYNSKKTKEMLEKYDGEYPVAVQLFGHEPMDFYKVISSGVLDKFDIIDINMGCPAPKIVKNGDGSKLLKNFDLAFDIISTCVKSTSKPVTVKFRKGYSLTEDVAVRFAKMCERAGASMITYHPRTKEQGYSGKIDVEDIRRVKEAVSIPVVGNGDVNDEKSYEAMRICADAVMIGRSAVGNPQIFSKLLGKDVSMNKKEIAQMHLDLLKKNFTNDHYILNSFRRHAFSYVDSVEQKRAVALSKSLKEMEEILF